MYVVREETLAQLLRLSRLMLHSPRAVLMLLAG
jgi:hypothetical protein